MPNSEAAARLLDATLAAELRSIGTARSQSRALATLLRDLGFSDLVDGLPYGWSSGGTRRAPAGELRSLLARVRKRWARAPGAFYNAQSTMLQRTYRDQLGAERKILERALGARRVRELGIVPPRIGRNPLAGLKVDGFTVREHSRRLSRHVFRAAETRVRRLFTLDAPKRDVLQALLRGPRSVRAMADRATVSLHQTLAKAARERAKERFWGVPENRKHLTGWRFVATLDERTTEICQGHHGLEWPPGREIRPPLHFRCRSELVAVLQGVGAPPVLSFAEWVGKMSEEDRAEILRLRRLAGGKGSRVRIAA